MNEGLEALKETAIQIVEALYGKEEPLRNNKINELLETKQFKIIKKELEDLNTIKKIFDDYNLEFKLTTLREAVFLLKQLQGEKSQCWDNALKKLEALKIIEKKQVQVAILVLSHSCDGYNMTRGLLGEYLEQEEYDFLKEVLSWIKD